MEIIIETLKGIDESIIIKNDKPIIKLYSPEEPLSLKANPLGNFHNFCQPTTQAETIITLSKSSFQNRYTFIPMFQYQEPYLYLINDEMDLFIFKVELNFPKQIYSLNLLSHVSTNSTIQREFKLFTMTITSDSRLLAVINRFLVVYDVKITSNPKLLSITESFDDFTNAVAFLDSFMFVGNYSNTVLIYNIYSSGNVNLLKSINLGIEIDENIFLQDLQIDYEHKVLLILDNILGFLAYDVSNINELRRIETNYNAEGGMAFEVLDNSVILTTVESSKSEELILMEYDITYVVRKGSLVSIDFKFVRNNGRFPILFSMYFSDKTAKYGILLFSNAFSYFNAGIPQDIIPTSEILKNLLSLGVQLPILIGVNKSQHVGFSEYIPNTIGIIIRDAEYMIVDIKSNSLSLFCNGTETLVEGVYKYEIIQISGSCTKNNLEDKAETSNHICMRNSTLSIGITRELPEKTGFIIGLSVGLCLTIIIFILCIIYYKRTQKYQKLYNELSQRNESYSGKLEIANSRPRKQNQKGKDNKSPSDNHDEDIANPNQIGLGYEEEKS